MKKVFISGELCSGKDTMVSKHYSSDKFKQIDLGTLVREKFQTQERIFDNNLEPYFIERIEQIRKENLDKTIVITGLRQPTLCKKISALFEKLSETPGSRIIVNLPPRHTKSDILNHRFNNRADIKDTKISFEDAIKGDQSLGMKELQLYLLTQVQCDFIKNYSYEESK